MGDSAQSVASGAKARTWKGMAFVALLATGAIGLSKLPLMQTWAVSPLVIGILLGMIHGNTLHPRITHSWHEGVHFTARRVLRLGIILYGFSLTVQQVWSIGATGLLLDTIIVTSTLLFAWLIGVHLLSMDRETALLTGAGSAICGAAAVLAFEPVVRAKGHQTAAAVATVVLFGTLSMMLYPALFRWHVLPVPSHDWGLYVGATVHEVAQVVGAASAIGTDTCNDAVIVKMTRVVLLTPALLLTGFLLVKRESEQEKHHIAIPWFALGFLGVVMFNSLHWLPEQIVSAFRMADQFLLTMAMTALGIESRLDKIRGVGLKPFMLAALLFVWLIFGGFAIVSMLAA